jgi:hypothetical protein
MLLRPAREPGLSEHVVVVDGVVMADVAEFDMARAKKLENDSIGPIDSKAPDLVMFWMKLFGMKRRVKGIVSKKFGFVGGFPLNRLRKCLE